MRTHGIDNTECPRPALDPPGLVRAGLALSGSDAEKGVRTRQPFGSRLRNGCRRCIAACAVNIALIRYRIHGSIKPASGTT